MTLKYESEILFDLMKRDGDDTPSDVLPYESELKEKYLNQVVGAYPKVQDYRAEWLNYNLYHRLPSDFPVESVANVTSASFNNVVPYTYGSAILKGQTLVNLIDFNEIKKVEGEASYEDGVITYNASSKWTGITFNLPTVKNSTVYTVVIDVLENTLSSNEYQMLGCFDGATNIFNKGFGIHKFTLTSWDDVTPTMSIVWKLQNVVASGVFKFKLMIIEGDHTNEDIPYFEGMTSVKVPVLKTTGKNLFDLELVQGAHSYSEVGKKPDFNNTTTRVTNATGNYIKVNSNTKITFSISNDIVFSIAEIDINGYGLGDTGWLIKSSHTITTKEKTSYIGFNFRKLDHSIITAQEVLDSNPMLEISDAATTYEPFKSNILTVNEPVELRGIGDVRDTLDLITGKLTQRIGEDGSVLSQEVVKTVDLSCVNEQGESETFRPIEGTMHVSTTSQTLPPLLDMSVPIEATSQNLMSFANIVEEE